MTEYKKKVMEKLMVQEELTRGTMAHWGIEKAVQIVEETPDDEVVRCRDCKHNPNDTWFECPIANLPYKEDRWCWKGERKDDKR